MTPEPVDIQPILNAALKAVKEAELGAGRYQRWLGEAARERADGTVLNPYGCADAANILYTLGVFPTDTDERTQWVQVLRDFQDADSGLFLEETHHSYHVTAHCLAALQLFDAGPLHSLRALSFLNEPQALESFLDQLDWVNDPWDASHQGAGLFAARVLADEASPEWTARYFRWLWEQQDAETGFWRQGCIGVNQDVPLFPHLAGSFHYLFNHEHMRQPLRYPVAMIDTCLHIRESGQWPYLGNGVGFADIDWVYCLTRALRQSGHRHGDVMSVLRAFTHELCAFLMKRIDTMTVPFDDLHALFGMLCALAELQAALPGYLRSDRPLHLVLDRRPFI